MKKSKAISCLLLLIIFVSTALTFGVEKREALASSTPGFANSGNGSWIKKQEIIIPPGKISGGATLVDFPVMITGASVDSQIFNQAKNDGCDIRFTKTGSEVNPEELPFERVVYSGSTLYFWVKRDLSSVSSTSIWIWWGNPRATCYNDSDTYGTHNVWRSEYKGVWHLSEASGTRIDSTSNNNDLADNNTVASMTGKLPGLGGKFEYNNTEYLEILDSAQSGLDFSTSFTFSTWFNFDNSTTNWRQFMGKWGSSDDYSFIFGLRAYDSTNDIGCIVSQNGSTINASWKDSFGYVPGTWQSAAVSYTAGSSNNPTFYKNGTSLGSSVLESGTRPTGISNSAVPFRVGAQGSTGVVNMFDGGMQETRAYAGILSDGWLATEFSNQNDPSQFALQQASQFVSLLNPPSELSVDGASNPNKVTDQFPEFSAVYEQRATTDSDYAVQIQVTASSTDWGDLVWDSGEIVFTDDIPTGGRLPSVTYGGEEGLLFDGSTYYWRIKSRNDMDEWTEWSTVGNFTMSNPPRFVFP